MPVNYERIARIEYDNKHSNFFQLIYADKQQGGVVEN